MPADGAANADLMMTLTEPSEPDSRMMNANAMLMCTTGGTAMTNATDMLMNRTGVTAIATELVVMPWPVHCVVRTDALFYLMRHAMNGVQRLLKPNVQATSGWLPSSLNARLSLPLLIRDGLSNAWSLPLPLLLPTPLTLLLSGLLLPMSLPVSLR